MKNGLDTSSEFLLRNPLFVYDLTKFYISHCINSRQETEVGCTNHQKILDDDETTHVVKVLRDVCEWLLQRDKDEF